MKLWLARHAQPLVAPGVCYGSLDMPADKQTTAAAARSLAQALPRNMPVACSPLRRCRQLGEALHLLRPDLAPQFDARLAEMDFGRWEGQLWNAIGKDALDAWTADFAQHRPGGGESVALFMQRVAGAFDALAASHDALWITHGGVIRAALLLSQGVRTVTLAHEWPATALDFGEHRVLAVAEPATS